MANKKRPLLLGKPMTISLNDMDDFYEHTWVTQEGEQIPVSQLEDNHIVNIIKMITNKESRHDAGHWLPILKQEQQKRLAKKTEMGAILYG